MSQTTQAKEYLIRLKRIQASKELGDIEYEKCKRDPWYWLCNWVFTLDVHNPTKPVRRFPVHHEYLEALTVLWAGPEIYKNFAERLLKFFDPYIVQEIVTHWTKMLAVPKSRQLKATWLFVSLYMWDTAFHSGRLTFFQSKEATAADELVKRAKFVYDHQPLFLKPYTVNPSKGGGDLAGKFEIPEIHSEIRGIPQGGDTLRSYTASGIFSDEMAFQDMAEECYTASKPTIQGGGRFTAVSSAAPGFFHLLVEDKFIRV